MSCKRSVIGTTRVSDPYSRQLYSTRREVRDLCLDWLRGTLMWLEDNRLLVMSMVEGQAKELHQLAGGLVGRMTFDLRANSLLWNSKIAGWLAFLGKGIFSCVLAVIGTFGLLAGLTTLSLWKERSHHAGRKLDVSGSVMAALEPFILSYSGDEITVWDQQDESILQKTTEGHQVLDVLIALKDIGAGRLSLVRHGRWNEFSRSGTG